MVHKLEEKVSLAILSTQSLGTFQPLLNKLHVLLVFSTGYKCHIGQLLEALNTWLKALNLVTR